MNSNELKVADQPELRLARQETKIELPIGMITQLPSLAANS